MRDGGSMFASMRKIAGVDEVGRGPLAGPLVAAAVILDPARPIAGLKDSKRLTPRRREVLAARIEAEALAVALGRCEVVEIDQLRIHRATLEAMRRAVLALNLAPDEVLVDGLHCPELPCPSRAIVGGDGQETAIAAASIVAKVHRDREMVALDRQFPGYGLAQHKGYPTRAHLEHLQRLGPAACHRRSFAPVQDRLTAGDTSLRLPSLR